MPKVSVLMPVYNTKEEYFREAIESVLKQSFADFELIIVDDCSEPYIAEVVKSYKDGRIRYFRLEKNSGASAARNLAIECAEGEFIAFLDSDDVSLENRLEQQIEYLEKNPHIGCLGTGVKGIGSEGEKVKFHIFSSGCDIDLFLILNGCAFCQSSVMLRKSVLTDNNIRYQTKYNPAEDYGLWLDLIGYTQFYVLPEVLTMYRYYPENISHRQEALQQRNSVEAQIAVLERYCDIHDLDKEAWGKFLKGIAASREEFVHLNNHLVAVIQSLRGKGYDKKAICLLLQRKFKKMFYRSHGIAVQWRLLTSPLNKILQIPLGWRLFCFITRGVL